MILQESLMILQETCSKYFFLYKVDFTLQETLQETLTIFLSVWQGLKN